MRLTATPSLKASINLPTTEVINHPAHYGGGDNPYEAIKVIEAWELGFCLGNTVKYTKLLVWEKRSAAT